jgi:hypothetical protein
MPGGELSSGFGMLRSPSASEQKFFKMNPHVAGYASEDNRVVLNPFRNFAPQELDSVIKNERIRLLIRKRVVPKPIFTLTDQQREKFRSYSNNQDDILATIVARAASGDPSVGDISHDQRSYIDMFLNPTLQKYGW